MMAKFAFLYLCGVVGVLALIHKIEARTVNTNVARIGQFPYVVSLRFKLEHFCSGTILDSTSILTAAHCLLIKPRYSNLETLFVVTGTNNMQVEGDRHEVKEVKCHENYNAATDHNDICIIKLTNPINLDANISAVKLPTTDIKVGETVTSCGWAAVYFTKATSVLLRHDSVKIMDQPKCQKEMSVAKLPDDLFCARNGDVGASSADSGSPLVDSKGVLVGVTSYSFNSCIPPYVFTNVYSHLDWIKKHL